MATKNLSTLATIRGTTQAWRGIKVIIKKEKHTIDGEALSSMLLALRSRSYFIRSLAYNERPDPCVPTKTLDCAPYKYRRTDRSSTQAMTRL